MSWWQFVAALDGWNEAHGAKVSKVSDADALRMAKELNGNR